MADISPHQSAGLHSIDLFSSMDGPTSILFSPGVLNNHFVGIAIAAVTLYSDVIVALGCCGVPFFVHFSSLNLVS